MYLTGSKQYNLDAKGRLTLPASYRKDFADQVCLIPLKSSLYGFTPEGFRAWVDSFFEQDGGHFNPRNRKDVQLRLLLTGSAVTVDIDSAGRIALGKLDAVDASARTRLGLDKDVTVVGALDHFEVWNTQSWNALHAQGFEEIDALMFGDED
ncbi:MAG: division/cell wall cluster transcriptional repressor MraZ [Atopobiaceae bacterium]|jgi:MraZ protein